MMRAVKKHVLPNGLTIVTEAMPSMRSISVGIWLLTGSRHERPEENGITHFLEHMVFKGTKNRTAEEIARSADAIGGHLDAFTTKEYTCFSIKVLDENLPRGFEILSDLVKNPLFQPEDIGKERQVIEEEIKMVKDTPDDLVHELFTQAYWRGHPLGRPILGTRQTVGRFNRPRLSEYFRSHYTPGNMIIAAAGHVHHGEILELVRREFGAGPSRSRRQPSRAPVAHPHLKRRSKEELEQAHICLGAPAYSQTHPKRYACYVLNTVLGGGISSRLFQNIREKRGLAYAVFSSLNMFKDAGCLTVYAGTAAQNARDVVRLIAEELRRTKRTPLSGEELQHAKDYLKGSLMLSLESTNSRMANLARQEMFFGRYISLDEIVAGVDSVSARDVQGVARNIFPPERLALTVLSPPNGRKISREDLNS
jgi:predicted Zn-dependent peptidase